MPAPHNPFKAALQKGELQLGCWLGLADAYVAEVSVVESAAQARALVDAVTYPPHGVRGVGSALARASDFSPII